MTDLKVKPLEWEWKEAFGAWRAHNYTLNMQWIVHHSEPMFDTKEEGWHWACIGMANGVEETLEDAKAAAQADYRARLLSCLDQGGEV